MPRHRIYRAKDTARNTLHEIHCAGQPPIAARVPARQAGDPAQPAKQKYQTDPTSLNPSQISTLQPSPDLAPSRAVETPARDGVQPPLPRASKRPAASPAPANHESPVPCRPAARFQHSPNAPNSNYQTNPISPTPYRISTLPSILPRTTLTRRTSLQACRVAIPVTDCTDFDTIIHGSGTQTAARLLLPLR